MVQDPALVRLAGPLHTSASTAATPKNTSGEMTQAAIKILLVKNAFKFFCRIFFI
jgi:hypothetical protein